MANYENGLDTKAKILDACKELFYLKGFEKTTFKEIGERANVNQGLIVYYYKNKNVLANTIFQTLITDMMKKVEEIFVKEDLLTRYFISDFLYFRLLYEDEFFRNYMETCCLNGALNKKLAALGAEYQKYYNEINRFFEDGYISDVTMKEGLFAVFEGMKDTYTLYTCQNFARMTVDVAATNYITIYCHLLDIPKNVYGHRMLNAELLSNQVEVSIEKFQFVMRQAHHDLSV